MIPNIPTYADQFPTCTKMEKINGYYCETTGIGILLWESEDVDSLDRSVQPIYIQYPIAQPDPKKFKENIEHQNKLNSFMDKNCDSFYTSQKRLSRFPGLIYAGEKDLVYNVVMTGTPPKKMKWVLRTEDPTHGVTVRIDYPSAISRSIVKDGSEVPYTDWIKGSAPGEDGGYGPVTQEFCG